ncbi:MAG: hypothetical protein ACRDHZ_01335 [Ktedonobacteraceae bacterium]
MQMQITPPRRTRTKKVQAQAPSAVEVVNQPAEEELKKWEPQWKKEDRRSKRDSRKERSDPIKKAKKELVSELRYVAPEVYVPRVRQILAFVLSNIQTSLQEAAALFPEVAWNLPEVHRALACVQVLNEND